MCFLFHFIKKKHFTKTHFAKTQIVKAFSSDAKKKVEILYDPDERLNRLADEVNKNDGISRLTLFCCCVDYNFGGIRISGSTIVGIGFPDPPQLVYDDDEYKDVFLSEASFITRAANQWYREPFSESTAVEENFMPIR